MRRKTIDPAGSIPNGSPRKRCDNIYSGSGLEARPALVRQHLRFPNVAPDSVLIATFPLVPIRILQAPP